MSRSRWLFAALVVAATLFLIFAGAQVKSHEAGLSVPDWPTSYGSVMPPMEGNIFFEHGHRMVAAGVGLLTIVLAVWIQLRESRRWLKALGWCALGAVVLQGVLGGLTVKYKLPPALSMSHGTLAQIFLCLVAWVAYASSREWTRYAGAPDADVEPARASRATLAARVALGCVFVQLLLGAWMRHSEAGLAVPFFPLSADGSLLPEHVNRLVWIHMAHRVFAFVVVLALLRAALLAGQVGHRLMGHAALVGGLVVVQGVLGATVVWTAKYPLTTSLHVTTGAALLVLSWLLVLRLWRLTHAPATAAAPALGAA